MPRLLVVVPGYGPGNLDTKQRLLTKNIDLIRRTYTGSVDVRLFNYGDVSCGVAGVDERFQRGYVGQFLYRHVSPDSIKDYDDILILLDDIELGDDIVVDEMLHNLKHYNLDILTPSLTHTSRFSHSVMLQQNTGAIRISAFTEFFCYFMTPASYSKWWSLLDEKSAWLWGIDFALFHKGFRMGLDDTHTMRHYFGSTGTYPIGSPNPGIECAHNMRRFQIQRGTEKLPPLRVVPWQRITS
jgi:hypothetical protein